LARTHFGGNVDHRWFSALANSTNKLAGKGSLSFKTGAAFSATAVETKPAITKLKTKNETAKINFFI